MRLSLLVLIFLGHLCFSQSILLKKNGEQLPFKKIKFHSNDVQIVTDNKVKIKINADDITAYYDESENKIFYKKQGIENPITWEEPNYDFFEMVTEGKINLYKKLLAVGNPYNLKTGGIADHYYAEKGMLFKNVFVADILRSHKKELERLKPLIEDDPELLKKMERESFKFNGQNLISAIKEYNVKHFKGSHLNGNQNQMQVKFYSKGEFSIEKLIIKVNDSLEYKLNPVHPVLINLSIEQPTKMCLIWGEQSWCELLPAISIPVVYYEIVYSISNKSFEIIRKSDQSNNYNAAGNSK
jgi:hypothetical protein